MRIFTLAIASLVMGTTAALGGTSLCIEESSTGFNWRQGHWVEATFSGHQYLVREIERAEEVGESCFERIAREARSLEPINNGFNTWSSGCYAIYDVGTEPGRFDVLMCDERWSDNGSVDFVGCEHGGFQQFKMNVPGEFVSYRTYAAPESDPKDDAERDSLVLSVGKCSVISP